MRKITFFLPLAALDQPLLVRRFDPDEDRAEIAGMHHAQKVSIGGKVDRGFGIEPEREAVLLLPCQQIGQQFLDVGLVADEIVIDQKHPAAPAQIFQPLQFVGLAARADCAVPDRTVATVLVNHAQIMMCHVGLSFQREIMRV